MAGISAADLQGILPGPAGSGSAPGPTRAAKTAAAAAARRAEKVSREVQALIGASAPPLALQVAQPQFKQKPKLGGSRSAKWQWRSFTNPARTDARLQLAHWARADADPAAYPFVKYNVQPTVYSYSQEEYASHVAAPSDDWSKEETDHLFHLVAEYDTRWYVVQDRYDFPGGVPRSIEDLKDRYYVVVRRLVRSRPWPGDEESKKQFLTSLQYDKDREVARKKYVRELGNRTQEQIMEEEARYLELKKLEQDERKFKRHREELLRTLLGMESGLPDILTAMDEDAPVLPAVSASDTKKRKRGSTLLDDVSSVSSPSAPAQLPPPRRPSTAHTAAYDAVHCIQRLDPPTNPSAAKSAHTAVSTRMAKIQGPKQAVAPKVFALLAEMGFHHNRLVMPTPDNVALLEQLYAALSAVVEHKKGVDRVEQEIRTFKARLGMDQEEEKHRDGDGDEENNDEDAMDLEARAGHAKVEPDAEANPDGEDDADGDDEVHGEDEDIDGDGDGDGEGDEEDDDGDGDGDGDGEVEEDGDLDADGEGDAEGDGEMDAEGEQDTTEAGTRAQSVVSTRSSRSRRLRTGKRSISVSSADTSATTTTRSGRRRQSQLRR